MSHLRVMTFNIHNIYNWERRKLLNIGVIKHTTPDIIGFQEAQPDNIAAYEQVLSDYDYLPGPDTGNEEQNYNAIFWKSSRLTHVESYGYWLSETPNDPSSGWGAIDRRAMFFVRFELHDSRQEFVHVNTHLDHRVEQARVEGTKLIVQKLAEFGYDSLPIILTGDFNCNPDSPVHQFLQGHEFVDVYRATGHKDVDYPVGIVNDSAYSNTFHAYGWTKPSSSGDERTGIGALRCDWIMLRDAEKRLKPVSCEIIREAQPPFYPSDHYPVVADFEIA